MCGPGENIKISLMTMNNLIFDEASVCQHLKWHCCKQVQ